MQGQEERLAGEMRADLGAWLLHPLLRPGPLLLPSDVEARGAVSGQRLGKA